MVKSSLNEYVNIANMDWKWGNKKVEWFIYDEWVTNMKTCNSAKDLGPGMFELIRGKLIPPQQVLFPPQRDRKLKLHWGLTLQCSAPRSTLLLKQEPNFTAEKSKILSFYQGSWKGPFVTWYHLLRQDDKGVNDDASKKPLAVPHPERINRNKAENEPQ